MIQNSVRLYIDLPYFNVQEIQNIIDGHALVDALREGTKEEL
jgi:hypothetical protein